MKLRQNQIIRSGARESSGYLLIEAMVYIGLLFALMGVAYVAVYRCIDRSTVLRRSLDDLSNCLAVGERWRADVRGASGLTTISTTNEPAPILVLSRPSGQVAYRFQEHAVWRRVGVGSWTKVLSGVKSSEMMEDRRAQVVAYRWEVELEPRSKGIVHTGRVIPMVSFTAAPSQGRAL